MEGIMVSSALGLSVFFFSSRRRHTRSLCDWSSDVCSSDLVAGQQQGNVEGGGRCLGQEFLQCHDEGGDGGLHVAGAAAVQLAVAVRGHEGRAAPLLQRADRKSTRLNSSHTVISYAVFCLKKKKTCALPIGPLEKRSSPPFVPTP